MIKSSFFEMCSLVTIVMLMAFSEVSANTESDSVCKGHQQGLSGRTCIQTGVSVSSGLHAGLKHYYTNTVSQELNLGYVSGAWVGRLHFFTTGLNYHFFQEQESNWMYSFLFSYIKHKGHNVLISPMIGFDDFITSTVSVRFRGGLRWLTSAGKYDSWSRGYNLDLGLNFYF
jgi:hypothetical protein